MCGTAITKCWWSYPTWWQWVVCWCIYVQLINVILIKTKSLWSTDEKILIDTITVPSNNKVYPFSWWLFQSCYGESFFSMCFFVKPFLSFCILLLSFTSPRWSVFVCCGGCVVFGIISYPFVSKVFKWPGWFRKAVYQFTKFIVCLWSVGFCHLFPGVIFYWCWSYLHVSLSYELCIQSSPVLVCYLLPLQSSDPCPHYSCMDPQSSIFLLHC